MFVDKRRTVLRVLGCALAALLAISASASARTIDVYSHQFSFNGSDSTAGAFSDPALLGINQSNGQVYEGDGAANGWLNQFDNDGNALPFSSLAGASSIQLLGSSSGWGMAVDNSGGPSNGRVYDVRPTNVLQGFAPDGSPLGAPFPLGGLKDMFGVAVDPSGNIWLGDLVRNELVEFAPDGQPTGKRFRVVRPGSIDIDSQGNFYVGTAAPVDSGAGVQSIGGATRKYSPSGQFLYTLGGDQTTGVAVDRSDDHVFVLENNFPISYEVFVREYDSAGHPLARIATPDLSFEGLSNSRGMAIDESNHRLYVGNIGPPAGGSRVEVFAPTGQVVVPTVTALPPTLGGTEVTLRGTVDTDGGGDTTECYFFYWYGGGGTYPTKKVPCNPATITGTGAQEVTAHLSGLKKAETYVVVLEAENANGTLALGETQMIRPQDPATITNEAIHNVNTDGAKVEADIDPNGGTTTYRFEYGLEDCASHACEQLPTPEAELPSVLGVQHVSTVLTGLQPGTQYHYRVTTNSPLGEVVGEEGTFSTFSEPSSGEDRCENALIRKQTGAALLPDCRAYELVSAASTGGYDVRSDLTPGLQPLTAVPTTDNGVLYSLSYGIVPGVSGEPPNDGSDPYVASRTSSGWTTEYAGLSVGNVPPQGTFSSAPTDESGDLSTFSFGGADSCAPCFADGTTGIPVRNAQGNLVQGMAGSLEPGPSAVPDGYVGQQLSADGTHLVFGSASKFEPDGNSNGDVSIYDHDLVTGDTHVVSKAPNGSNLTCLQGAGACHGPGDPDGIGMLGMSEDGSRIVVAQLVSTDAAGNHYWHPYMTIDDGSQSVDLAPGATSGVLFDGMTADGSAVFYTTSAKLVADDEDNSPDIYEAAVAKDGSVTVTRVSTGTSGTGNTDSCNPTANEDGNNWNAVGAASPNTCGAVAFAGGAGVASESPTIYFLSPEKLDGPTHGVSGEPNLYVSGPGLAPRFIATLEPDNPAVRRAVSNSSSRTYADIQVTPSGDFAAFDSNRALTGYPNAGHYSIFRYLLAASTLECASCSNTRATLIADTKLDPFGLNLTDDGHVFFSTSEPLVLVDSGSSEDVYEWDGSIPYLISTGRSSSSAKLLSVSSNGVNAYFFTRDRLVSGDHNGDAVRIYDARENGGFLSFPVRVPCQASDECHGPGSQAAASSEPATNRGSTGNFKQRKKKHHKHKHHRQRRPHSKKRGSR